MSLRFDVIEWFTLPGRGTFAKVRLDRETTDFAHLRNQLVVLDDVEFFCAGIERHPIGLPHLEGEEIALLVMTLADAVRTKAIEVEHAREQGRVTLVENRRLEEELRLERNTDALVTELRRELLEVKITNAQLVAQLRRAEQDKKGYGFLGEPNW